jgi:hypothetical protein
MTRKTGHKNWKGGGWEAMYVSCQSRDASSSQRVPEDSSQRTGIPGELKYQAISKSFRTESITKQTTINTR